MLPGNHSAKGVKISDQLQTPSPGCSALVARHLSDAFALVSSLAHQHQPGLEGGAGRKKGESGDSGESSESGERGESAERNIVSIARFIAHAQYIADRLPDAAHAINLCENRYLFTVAFAAVLLRKQTNLLPQNRTLVTQAQLAESYQKPYVLHDGAGELSGTLASFDVNDHSLPTIDAEIIPEIALDQLAAISFTSGSTGKPKANLKTWRTCVESTQINARQMLAALGANNNPQHHAYYSCLATVPGQHMWGLETTVLMPMISRVCVSDRKPLFPQDIATQLRHMGEPRMLVSTPVHLRALSRSGVVFPRVSRVLCATAPLPQALARDVETLFGAELIEIYGCSEVGSMARRRTRYEKDWQLFPELRFEQDGAEHVEKSSRMHAAHLPGPVEMQDQFNFKRNGRFELAGRNEDMIEVGGKRGSLLELNAILADFPGVRDSVVFMPDINALLKRPAALIVAEESIEKAAIQALFARKLDRVFTPRPIYFVAALPREENGKLKRSELLALFRHLSKRVTSTD